MQDHAKGGGGPRGAAGESREADDEERWVARAAYLFEAIVSGAA